MARISSLRAALLACLAVIAIGAHPAAAKGPADLPAVYLTDAARLAETRARVLAGDPALAPAVAALIELADEAAKLPMVSIADKPAVPPSGNRNDYVSLAPYWWPNPDTDDGLPYVRRDGRVNPERDLYDVNKLNNFGAAVRWSGFAYYFTGDERYAQEAVRRIRHFLIDPETAMTPRMLYGQFIPGVNNGREIGLIETLRL
ncbi:MAG: alginate lyase family protein, partial [Planctomycetota bacterium]